MGIFVVSVSQETEALLRPHSEVERESQLLRKTGAWGTLKTSASAQVRAARPIAVRERAQQIVGPEREWRVL